MSRYIRYKYQKQLINFLNCCDNCNEWIETCQTRVTGFDSVCGLGGIVNSDDKYYLKIETNDQWRYIKTRPDWFVGWGNINRIDYESFSNIGVPNSTARIRMYYKGYDGFFSYGSDAESDKDYLIIGNEDEDLSIYDYESILSLNKSDYYTTKNEQRKGFARGGNKNDGKIHFIDFVFIKNSDTNVGEDRAYVSFYLPDDFNNGTTSSSGGNNLETQPCDCGEVWAVEPLFNQRFTKLNPNYDWFCIDGNRHYKIMKQYSYDDGKSWIDTQEYEVGEVYEYDSPWCNGEECIDPKKKWEVYNTKISGNTTITEFIKQYSFDNLIWNNLGYIDDKGDVTYEFKKLATNIEGCGRESAIEYEMKAGNKYIDSCETYANPIVQARYRLGNYNYKNDSIIWDNWGNWYILAKDIDYTIILPTIEKNETNNEIRYNFEVQGLGKYSDLTASGKIIQSSGPCTPPVTPDPIPPTPTPDPTPTGKGKVVYTYDSVWDYSTFVVNGQDVTSFDKPKVSMDLSEIPISTLTGDCGFKSDLVHLIEYPDVGEIEDFSGFFEGCVKAIQLDIENWDMSKATNISYMFMDCVKLPKLDLSRWDVSKVVNMRNLFHNCKKIEEIDLSGWDIPNVIGSNMSVRYYSLFYNCDSLKKLYVKNNIVWWKERLSECGVYGCEVIVK